MPSKVYLTKNVEKVEVSFLRSSDQKVSNDLPYVLEYRITNNK